MGLAVQVKRTETGGTRLIRFWAVNAITPLEKSLVSTSHGVRNVWRNYLYLRGVRQENRDLKAAGRAPAHRAGTAERGCGPGPPAAGAARVQGAVHLADRGRPGDRHAAAATNRTSSTSTRASSDGIKPDMAVITAGRHRGQGAARVSRFLAGAADQRSRQRCGCDPGIVALARHSAGDGRGRNHAAVRDER